MSYCQDGGNIVHHPASTHASYSSRMNSYGSTITSNYSPSQHGSTSHVQHHQHHGHHGHHGHHSTSHTTSSSNNNPYHHHQQQLHHHHHQPPPSSGNSPMSMEASRDSLLEAGDLVLNTSASPAAAADTPNRRKPDIGIVVSVISFLVWLRLFQTMFYQSVLGNLEGFIKEFLFILLVWIPSITLTCFYFRSDDYQRRFRAAVIASGAR